MSLVEIKAYVKDCEYAYNAFLMQLIRHIEKQKLFESMGILETTLSLEKLEVKGNINVRKNNKNNGCKNR